MLTNVWGYSLSSLHNSMQTHPYNSLRILSTFQYFSFILTIFRFFCYWINFFDHLIIFYCPSYNLSRVCYYCLSPTKGDWCPHEWIFFIGTLSPSFFKVLHQFLCVHHVFVAIQVVSFMVSSPFDQIFLSFGLLTLEDALYSIFQMTSYKVGRCPNHLLVISPQGVFLNWL